jgi:hypothetical protein
MEHRVVGVHRHDRVHVAARPRGPVTNSQVLNLSAHRESPSIARSKRHYNGLEAAPVTCSQSPEPATA